MRLAAFEKMQRKGVSRLLVAEGDRLLGIISLKDLLQFLSLKLDLEGRDENGAASSRSPEEKHEPVLHR